VAPAGPEIQTLTDGPVNQVLRHGTVSGISKPREKRAAGKRLELTRKECDWPGFHRAANCLLLLITDSNVVLEADPIALGGVIVCTRLEKHDEGADLPDGLSCGVRELLQF
jgi:hypothetical protein